LVYLYTDEIELTVNIALATSRPILLRGPSGAGKSSLAKNIALRLGRRYYEEVVTSKTEHDDFLWRIDLLRRFRDAQADKLLSDHAYVDPGVLWWAFDRTTASRRGSNGDAKLDRVAVDPSKLPGENAVVLIDEIDKADPDVPNNLLVAVGSLEFSVPFLNDLKVKAAEKPLVLITSNNERDLPAAFLRRCIMLELQAPPPERLIEIATKHFGDKATDKKLYKAVADILYPETGSATPQTSTAEYLDAVKACKTLGVTPKAGDAIWDCVVRTTVTKARGDV
jgi:MoxR-like ATPase